MASKLAQGFAGLADWLFPDYTCLVCGGELNGADNSFLCNPCTDKFVLNTEPLVLRDNKATQHFTRAFCPFIYGGEIAKLILRLKYSAEADVAKGLAPFMAASCIHQSPKINFDVIIPVPLAAKRFRQRGYNQSLLLAEELSHFMKIPVEKQALVRIKHTAVQKEMTVKQRAQNIKDAFDVLNADLIKGRRILLIDDVFTSGTTVNECAKVLKQAGATRVDVLTIACAALDF